MQLTLGPEAQRLIEERLKRGGYTTAEEVVLSGLASLQREEAFGDFAPGEWDELLAEAERSGEPIDAEEVFAEIRQLSASARERQQKP
jgi:Arc/MetJ-type ribon-helix-helix transcriptional regulator